MRDESEERSVHRYEAFSDVVIGFSLAQLGASLAIPHRPIELFNNLTWLIGFAWAFALVCSMWWFHHRFFRQLFVPNAVPILLNFAWLGVVILCVYTAQLLTKFTSDTLVWRMYCILFGLAYGLLAVQYRVGMRLRGSELAPEKRLAALRASAFMHLWTVPFIVCAVIVFVLPFGSVSGIAINLTFVAAAVASGIMARRFRLEQRKAAVVSTRPSA